MKMTPPPHPPPLPCEFVILNSGPSSNTTLRNSDDVVISSIRESNIKPDTREQSLNLDWIKNVDDLILSQIMYKVGSLRPGLPHGLSWKFSDSLLRRRYCISQT